MFINTKQFILVSALLVCARPTCRVRAASRNLKSKQSKQKPQPSKKSAAWDYGYLQAKGVWWSGNHDDNCTFKTVADEFWGKNVCSIVYDLCEDNYEYISDMIDECKDGATAFTEEKVGECIDMDKECKGFGEKSSRGVASTYCNQPIAGTRSSLFPEACVTYAIDHCRANFRKDIKAYVDGAGCNGKWPMSDKDFSKYREQCEEEVTAMTTAISLPNC